MKVSVRVPVEDGFENMSFKAQFKIPDGETFKADTQNFTVPELLDCYLLDAKEIVDEDGKEAEFNSEVKNGLINSIYIRQAMFEAWQKALSGGKS